MNFASSSITLRQGVSCRNFKKFLSVMAGVFVNQLLHKNTQRNRRPRVLKERRNAFEFLSDAELVERYRSPRAKYCYKRNKRRHFTVMCWKPLP